MKREIAKYQVKPHFVIIQVNEDEASNAYVKGKIKDGNEIGIIVTLKKYPLSISEKSLINEIESINQDDKVDGLIVQMPLPAQINEEHIKLSIAPNKDVDGFHPLSTLDPCTPKGIINFLVDQSYDFDGKNAVVIGRSNIVGKPMAKLLLAKNMNVTVCHSKTNKQDMNFYIAHADLIVIAIGKKHFLNHSFTYKNDAIIFDVGINREQGKLYGDALEDLPVLYKSPVPGGVGLLTRLTLLTNLYQIFRNKKRD